MIDVTGPANLVTWIQADFLVWVAEEPLATLGIRARLIPDCAGARFAVARCLGEIFTPGQALAAAKHPSVRAAPTERIVREAPGIGRAFFTGI